MWRCAQCDEELEPQFDSCWKCGAARPGIDAEAAPSVDAAPPERGPACPRCGGREIVPGVRILDRSEHGLRDLTARIERDPSAWVLTGAEDSDVRAEVCRRCGHVSLIAAEPERLWRAHLDRRGVDEGGG